MRQIEGDFIAPQQQIAIVAARFNGLIVDPLIQGAQDMLLRHQVNTAKIDLVRVPGALELPLICQQLANTGRYQGIIALGAVIRGATSHYDVVVNNCANHLVQVSLASQVPIILGVLTTETVAQALERAGTKAGNKGADAALALLETMNVVVKING